jgi:anti-sigma factor RsiW
VSAAASVTCRQVVDLVTEYLEGSMPVSERVAFEQHVALCPPCRAYLVQLRKVVRVAGAVREEDLSPAARESLRDAFRDWKAHR